MLAAGILWKGLQLMSPTPTLGPTAGRLLPCPDSPNCVCSHETDGIHAIPPLDCPGPATATQELERLQQVVSRLPRLALVEARPGYLRFQATTAFWRFRDDLEFLADDARRVIHVRSASRLGYSDVGTNRRRVERIRELFQSTATHAPR